MYIHIYKRGNKYRGGCLVVKIVEPNEEERVSNNGFERLAVSACDGYDVISHNVSKAKKVCQKKSKHCSLITFYF